jgi:hypothetical protein
MREHLKFKQLLNQFKSLKFEEEYLKDYLMEANELLEEALDEYIESKGISREDLEGGNPAPLDLESDDGGRQESSTEPLELKHFKKAHRKLLKILHPDRQRDNDPRKEEYEEDFKRMTAALNEECWADFFDIADKYNVKLDRVEEANRLLIDDIDKASDTIETKKKTFAWFLAQCGDSADCRENVMEVYLRSKYGWIKDQ